MKNTKPSFYKTMEEKKLARCVDEEYNNIIGGNENARLDGSEYSEWTEEELVEHIVDIFMTTKGDLYLEDSWEVLEAKHIRFMGKARVREIVKHRVEYRHNKEGKWSWEK